MFLSLLHSFPLFSSELLGVFSRISGTFRLFHEILTSVAVAARGRKSLLTLQEVVLLETAEVGRREQKKKNYTSTQVLPFPKAQTLPK